MPDPPHPVSSATSHDAVVVTAYARAQDAIEQLYTRLVVLAQAAPQNGARCEGVQSAARAVARLAAVARDGACDVCGSFFGPPPALSPLAPAWKDGRRYHLDCEARRATPQAPP